MKCNFLTFLTIPIRSFILLVFVLNFNAYASDVLVLWKQLKSNNIKPTDPEYWNYYKRYVNHSVLDLIVSGEDSEHLYKNLKTLLELKQQNVIIGKVIVVGGNNFAFLNKNSRTQLNNSKAFYLNLKRDLGSRGKNFSYKNVLAMENKLGISPELSIIAERIGFDRSRQIPEVKVLLNEFNVNTSPTWIISHQNKQVIYEGEHPLNKFFTNNGIFLAGNSIEKHITHYKSKIGIQFVAEKERDKMQNNRISIAMDYDLQPWKILPGAGTYDALPECKESVIRKTKVVFSSSDLKEFDITYYKLEDTPKRKGVSGILTAYIPGDLSNPMRNPNNLAQNLARLLDIRCLPTRVHYVTIEGKMFEEYREKEHAWN